MDTTLFIFCRAGLSRAAWQALLEKQPGIGVAAAVAAISDLPESIPPNQATTVFVDAPEADADFVARLSTAVPDGGLLFLVNEYRLEEIVWLLQAGAAGVIARNAAVPDLARAIIAAGRGEIVAPPSLASQVMLALARGYTRPERPLDSLTSREKEVLALLAQGLTNKDIAQTLILSVRTIEAHLRNIYGKLRVNSRTEAALWAVNHGFGGENR
ncbi:MAG TPA: response regulator transcription factor [Anaerolineae bacterium]|nr:response regulator transcription factor [Anaerolineae bacterium]